MPKTYPSTSRRFRLAFILVPICAALIATCVGMQRADAAAGGPELFGSPEKAVAALVSAATANDSAQLLRIFGPEGGDLVGSGDPVADKLARARFVTHYSKGGKVLRTGTHKATLAVGSEEWPFPIPIVERGNGWYFDTQAGAEEILDRRIGRNELSAIEVCRNYVRAQRDYVADVQAAHAPVEFAQKFISSPGQHDGLYWTIQPGETESPIGPQMASAQAQGYDGSGVHSGDEHVPYHGYYYKILTRQGQAAPGGARDYIVAGHMTGGFAMIAYPAKYGDSGVMTFVVNQDGIVFEKDLGKDTTTAASAITEFNPDMSWKPSHK